MVTKGRSLALEVISLQILVENELKTLREKDHPGIMNSTGTIIKVELYLAVMPSSLFVELLAQPVQCPTCALMQKGKQVI